MASISDKYFTTQGFEDLDRNASCTMTADAHEHSFLTGEFAGLANSRSRLMLDELVSPIDTPDAMQTRTVLISLSYSDVQAYIGTSGRVGDAINIDLFVGVNLLSRGKEGILYFETKKHVFTTIGDTFVLSHNTGIAARPMPTISISLTQIYDSTHATNTDAAEPQATWDFVTFLFELPASNNSKYEAVSYDKTDAIPADSVAGSVSYFATANTPGQSFAYPCILQPDMDSFKQYQLKNKCAALQSVRFVLCARAYSILLVPRAQELLDS